MILYYAWNYTSPCPRRVCSMKCREQFIAALEKKKGKKKTTPARPTNRPRPWTQVAAVFSFLQSTHVPSCLALPQASRTRSIIFAPGFSYPFGLLSSLSLSLTLLLQSFVSFFFHFFLKDSVPASPRLPPQLVLLQLVIDRCFRDLSHRTYTYNIRVEFVYFSLRLTIGTIPGVYHTYAAQVRASNSS